MQLDEAWADQYGGTAWVDICKTCIDLQIFRKKDLKLTLLYIDRLNDLEHNNDLYLIPRCSFILEEL